MALYVKQNEPRTQLSNKVSADLSSRLQKRALEPNDAKQAAILTKQRKTSTGGIFWTVIASVVIVAALWYLIFIF